MSVLSAPALGAQYSSPVILFVFLSVALERSKSAREAIQIMGDLATELGFYAAATGPTVSVQESQGEGGEGLTVIDKHEAWVFHVSGDDTGTSAVWVAQRVPDGHVRPFMFIYSSFA